MTNEARVNEIIGMMQSFPEEKYFKKDLLPQYFALQAEIINATFNGEHAEKGKLKLWDVENHLEKLNEECGHIADKEFSVFKESSKAICNAIKAETSGAAGEIKAFHSLERIRCKNKVLQNIELRSEKTKTELDAIVFTEKAVFVIEVKNPHRDIYIDERGNYCKITTTMLYDCNIGEKMDTKEFLLAEAFRNAGFDNVDIRSLVVFTNSEIRVDNHYDYIQTCFLSSLPHIIENIESDDKYSEEDIANMAEIIEKAEQKETYPPDVDINKFKRDFATLMVTLETASAERTNEKKEVDVDQDHQTKENNRDTNNEFIVNKQFDVKGTVVKTILAVATFLFGYAVGKYLDETDV